MWQQSDAHPRDDARPDHRTPAVHGTGDALPPPFGRLFPDLAAGPPPTPRSADPATSEAPARAADPAGVDDGAEAEAERELGFARLVTHDLGIVADPAPGVLAVPATAPPTLALDGLYGPGPFEAPQLYDPDDRARLRRPDRPGLRRDLAAVHDAVVDEVRAEGLVFWPVVLSAARRRVVHRYQREVLDGLLPRWVGRPQVDDVRRHGRRFYRPEDAAFVPLELLALAPWLVPTHAPVRPCPAAWTLPPGRAVAEALGVAPLADLEATDLDPEAPLDDYVVAESRVVAGGRRLGPVGGRILAEVVIGVLELDVDSCLGPLAPPSASASISTPSLPPSPGPGPRTSHRPATA